MAGGDGEHIRLSIPEPAIGFAAGAWSASLMSTTTAAEVMKVLATDAACSKQHLTTCFVHNRVSLPAQCSCRGKRGWTEYFVAVKEDEKPLQNTQSERNA